MKDTTPLVYISLLNWNTCADTLSCLQALAALEYPNARLIVVDNASTDGSPQVLRRARSDATLICAADNLGYAGGHKLALDLALDENADLLWLVNPDIQFSPEVLRQLIAAYLRRGEGIYGSLPLHRDPPFRVGYSAWPVHADGTPRLEGRILCWGQTYRETARRGAESSPILRVANVHGCSMLIPLAVVRAHGFMDESYFLYGEEYDYCFRLARRGAPSYLVPASVVFHRSMPSARRSESLGVVLRSYYLTRNLLVLRKRHWGPADFWAETKRQLALCWSSWAEIAGRRRPAASLRDPYYRLLGVRDALVGRMGKTLRPEDFVSFSRAEEAEEEQETGGTTR
jgi:GT2 family glycosyltransferase